MRQGYSRLCAKICVRWRMPPRQIVGILLAVCATALAPLSASAASPTITTLTSSQDPSVFGQTVTFTATVSPLGPGTPTGTVTFNFGDGSAPATSVLTAGQVIFTHIYEGPGTLSATATYSGDVNFTTSTATLQQTVNQASTTTSLTSGPSPSVFGQTVTFTATVSPVPPGSGTPTGAVQFMVDGTLAGSATLSGGVATFSTNALTVSGSPHSIQAIYSGDVNFTTSSQTSQQTVNQASTITTLTSSQNPSGSGPVTFTATVSPVSPGSGIPTGTVTIVFGDGSAMTGTLSGGQATFTHTYSTPGSFTATATYSGNANFTLSSSSNSLTVTQSSTTTTVASSLNPSNVGQAVTFTATVASSSGTPTGSVTFKDGGTAIGTAVLAGGSAAFTTSALALGNHSITAVYGGGTTFTASTSAALTQSVAVPADSVKLRALQVEVTKMEAQGSAAAITGAVDDAIEEAFSEGGQLITPNAGGLRLNFAAEPEEKTPAAHVGDTFAALGYANDNVYKAPPLQPVSPPKQWFAWADVRGTGWNTNVSAGDISGGQINALAGLTRKLTPDFLVGLFGGYESFDYTSQLLDGTLRGGGWTVGAYTAWRLLPGLRLDAGVARSEVDYNGTSGTAAASFPGDRWIASTGVTGTYRTQGFEIEPSARVYGVWEHDNAYVDSLGTQQAALDFSTGRASAGAKVTYPWAYSATMIVAPYAGLYTDYYFSNDAVTATLLPTEFIQGWSARVTSGVSVTFIGGAKLSVGGEVGGLGSGQFTVFSVRGRASVPF
jgi:hypothetical protein